MRKRTLAFLLLAGSMLAGSMLAGPALAASAPRLSIGDLRNLPILTMQPYDETANADAAVDAAFARARKNHKLVLIDLGGNWCADCIILANVMRLPEMRHFVEAHYEVAAVDVGRFDRNPQIPARFGITRRLEGVPAVLIATPDGKLVNPGHVSALEDARHMTAQAMADWLARWTK
jgi:thiol-disulfide isomerase/thioredoxin